MTDPFLVSAVCYLYKQNHVLSILLCRLNIYTGIYLQGKLVLRDFELFINIWNLRISI